MSIDTLMDEMHAVALENETFDSQSRKKLSIYKSQLFVSEGTELLFLIVEKQSKNFQNCKNELKNLR